MEDGWQDALIDSVRAKLEQDEDVVALVLFGSWADPSVRDRFSDVDVMLVVRAGAAQRFFPTTDWIAEIAPVFATERSARERSGAHRVYFEDGRRFDAVVVEEPVLTDIARWPQHRFRSARRIVFSRSAVTDRAAAEVYEPLPGRAPGPEPFATSVNAFWFEAQVVIHKAVRGDLLVASHVYLGLVRACIEMAMALRDRAAGTHHHRTGAPTDATVLARIGAPPGAFTAIELVEAVAKVVAAFDDLASEWDTAYRRRRHLLKPMFASARAFVSAASATQAG